MSRIQNPSNMLKGSTKKKKENTIWVSQAAVNTSVKEKRISIIHEKQKKRSSVLKIDTKSIQKREVP